MPGFIWDDANLEHAQKHDLAIEDIEYVVNHASRPWPMPHGGGKFIVRGQTESGHYVQVIYVLESDAATIDYTQVDLVDLADVADAIYVIHARPLEENEKVVFRKLNRRKRKR